MLTIFSYQGIYKYSQQPQLILGVVTYQIHTCYKKLVSAGFHTGCFWLWWWWWWGGGGGCGIAIYI